MATFKEIWEDGVKLEDLIDTVISHNEIVNLWYINTKDDNGFYRMFHGMGWAIPDEYLQINVSRIIGLMTEKAIHSDEVNILMNVTENDFTHDLPAKELESARNDGEERKVSVEFECKTYHSESVDKAADKLREAYKKMESNDKEESSGC